MFLRMKDTCLLKFENSTLYASEADSGAFFNAKKDGKKEGIH